MNSQQLNYNELQLLSIEMNSLYQSLNKIYSLGDSVCTIKKPLIPKNISIDKESLYEQLIQEKRKNKQLNLQMNKMIAQQHTLEREPVLNDEVTVKRDLKQLQLQLLRKDQEAQVLKDQLQKRHFYQELSETKHELQKYKVYHKFNCDTTQIIKDNIQLYQQCDEMKSVIQELEKNKADCILAKSQLKAMKKVLQEKDRQIEKYKSRDPLLDIHKRLPSQNEQHLYEELQEKLEEIEHLRQQLLITKKNHVDDQKQFQAQIKDFQTKVNALEYEKSLYRDKIEQLQKENTQLQEKAKLLDRFMNNSTKRKSVIQLQSYEDITLSQNNIPLQPSITNIPLIEDDQLVRCVQKDQIINTAIELKLQMRKKKYSLQDLEKLLFGNKDSISISELQYTFQREPFKISQSNYLARYILEDNQQDEYNYDPDLQVPVAQARSVFKTLMSNYQINDEKQIRQQFDKLLPMLQDYFTRKQIQKFTVQQLMDAAQSLELQLNSKHLDLFQQMYYDMYNQFQTYETNLLSTLQ
ncbi:hypothetical protein pb186bvf_016284 [Paramecium bursaria]